MRKTRTGLVMLVVATAPHSITGYANAQAVGRGLDCLIEPSQVVELRLAADGLIAAVHVKRGDTIRRGQPLVELQSAAEKLAVESARHRAQMEAPTLTARNRVAYASAKLARLTQLQKDNFASVQARDEADAELRLAESEQVAAAENREAARIELRRAEEQLLQRTALAPFNGVVLDRLLHPGDLAEAGSGRKPVLRLAQIDPLKVDIVVPASLFGVIKIGTRAVITPHGLPGRHVAAVSMLDKVVDAASGTFVVRLELPNPNHALAGGLRCTAELEGVASARGAPRGAGRPAP